MADNKSIICTEVYEGEKTIFIINNIISCHSVNIDGQICGKLILTNGESVVVKENLTDIHRLIESNF